MTRAGLLLLVVGGLIGGGVFWAVYGAKPGLLMGALMVACGAPAVAGAHLLAARRGALGGLSRQFAASIALTVGLVMLAIVVIALLMFVSPHDAVTMAVLVVFAGSLTAYAAWVSAAGVMRDVEAVGRGVRAIGEGERELVIETEARDEIAALAEAAERMAASLAAAEREREAAEDARRGVVAAVSHDLRTPLTSMRLLADAVGDELVDRRTASEYMNQMSAHIAALSGLVEDLFELSRIEAGDIRWSMERVALGELVEETVQAMRPQAEGCSVAVVAAVDDFEAAARANPEKVQRVLVNLIQNAIRHTPEDGSVTVAAESNGANVEIEVADTGPGLDGSDRDRAFEPFFRGGDGARSGDGSGLGLAICRAIVEAHGGRIWFAEARTGTRVRFTLPLAG